MGACFHFTGWYLWIDSYSGDYDPCNRKLIAKWSLWFVNMTPIIGFMRAWRPQWVMRYVYVLARTKWWHQWYKLNNFLSSIWHKQTITFPTTSESIYQNLKLKLNSINKIHFLLLHKNMQTFKSLIMSSRKTESPSSLSHLLSLKKTTGSPYLPTSLIEPSISIPVITDESKRHTKNSSFKQIKCK